jgi:hypothetical protein
VWALAPEKEFQKMGDECFFQIILKSQCIGGDQGENLTVFLFWRLWHHRNDVIHGEGKASIAASVQYLQNYETTFSSVNEGPLKEKGKRLMFPSQATTLVGDEWPLGGLLPRWPGPD